MGYDPVMGRVAAAVLALTLAGAPLSAAVAAEIYRYADESGTPHYVDGLQNVPERYRANATPIGLRNSPPAPAGSAPAGDTASGSTVVRFSPGQRITVDATVNGSTATRLLLDTGADQTLISPRVLAAAGVSLTRGATAGQVRGVTGSADVQGVVIDSLEVGEARVDRLTVIAHEMDQPGIDGLLGRDFLEQFNVTIDSSQGVVTIAPK